MAYEERQKAYEERQRKRADRKVDDDDHSDVSSVISTAPTETASTLPQYLVERGPARPEQLVLRPEERRELLKVEKLLRQLDTIQKNLDAGQKLDRLQVEKLQRRAELESSVVMLKIKGGWQRGA